MNAAKRPLSAWLVFSFVAACLSVCLVGCGGGGNSSTDEGFRFVPNGQGAVIPYPNVQFEYDAGSVGSGTVVTAAPVTAGLPTVPSGATELGSAYRVTFSTGSITFSPPARFYLQYDPTKLPASSVPRIYISTPGTSGASAWQVLPVSTVAPQPAAPATPTGITTLEAQLPATIPSGSLLTIFAGTPSGLTGLNPFFGNYTLTDSSTPPVIFGFSVAADGTVSGTTAGTTVTGTVSTAGAASIVSGGQTYTGTLAADTTTGAVTVSDAVWSGGTWSLQ